MKPYILLLSFLSTFVYAKQEFTNFNQVPADLLWGLIKCIETRATDKRDDAEIFEPISWNEQRKLLMHQNFMRIQMSGPEGLRYKICSRDQESIAQLIAASKQEEQAALGKLGYRIRSSTLHVFPYEERDKVEIEVFNKETNAVEKKDRHSIKKNEVIGFNAPAMFLGVVVKNHTVSNEELGYFAQRLLQERKDQQIDRENFSLRLTVPDPTVPVQTINLSDLLPKNE